MYEKVWKSSENPNVFGHTVVPGSNQNVEKVFGLLQPPTIRPQTGQSSMADTYKESSQRG